MRLHPANGIWDLFVPGLTDGEMYKFELLGADGTLLPLKSDPLARSMEPPPGNASIVYESSHHWRDAAWMARRPHGCGLDRPLAIYEVHPGSWRHRSDAGHAGERLSYRELAVDLVAYACDILRLSQG